MEVKGRDLVSGIPKIVRVHSSEIREAVQEPIQQIVDAVRRALEITPPELASDIVDRGIVMTGGGALIRGPTCWCRRRPAFPSTPTRNPRPAAVPAPAGSPTIPANNPTARPPKRNALGTERLASR